MSHQLPNPDWNVCTNLRLEKQRTLPILEFRSLENGSIQRREYASELETSIGPENGWQTLSRLEVMHYLNYGGIVGVWLEDLRAKGVIQTRQLRRAAACGQRSA